MREFIMEKIYIAYQIIACITGVVSFFAIWIYAFTSWGFLIGLAVGWLPAIIGAFLIGALWPIALPALFIFL